MDESCNINNNYNSKQVGAGDSQLVVFCRRLFFNQQARSLENVYLYHMQKPTGTRLRDEYCSLNKRLGDLQGKKGVSELECTYLVLLEAAEKS
jgi:hypothetical protein